MKPPPRRRTKPDRFQTAANSNPQPADSRWRRAEQKQLLRALQELSKTAGGQAELDYGYLRQHVPTRSESEIRSVVEDLKAKVISSAHISLKKQQWQEEKTRKPIELWTNMASTVCGALEDPLSSAFSQMLKVSSTEPRTLRNCDPPHSTDEQKPPAQTIPLRPSPHLPGPGGLSHISAAATAAAPPLLIITSAPAVGAAKTLQAPAQVFRVPGPAATSTSQPDPSFCQPAATQTLTLPPAGLLQPASLSVSPASSKQAQPLPLMTVHIATAANTESVGAPAIQVTPRPLNVVRGHPVSVSRPQQHAHPATRASSSSSSSQHPLKTEMPSVSIISSSVHNTHSSSASGLTPIPSFTPSSSSSSSSSSQAGYGQTSKRDSPRTCGVRSVVDFEKIYHYLSVVHEPNTAFALTPTESAVVLDLLMSLQEELPLLDCNKLQRHFAQVYRCLSSSANSSMAEQMFKDLQAAKEGSDKHEFHAESHQTPRSRDQVTGPEPNRDRTGPEPDQDGTGPEPDLSKTRVKTMSERSVSSGESDRKAAVGCEGKTRDETAESQSAERPFPPLNPFMVPLKLLMRR